MIFSVIVPKRDTKANIVKLTLMNVSVNLAVKERFTAKMGYLTIHATATEDSLGDIAKLTLMNAAHHPVNMEELVMRRIKKFLCLATYLRDSLITISMTTRKLMAIFANVRLGLKGTIVKLILTIVNSINA